MRRCAFCGRCIDGCRADRLTCSDKCRTALWRQRKARAVSKEGEGSLAPVVTVRKPLVTLTTFVGGPCPDANRCRHLMRFPNGPWSCEYCHPRIGSRAVAA